MSIAAHPQREEIVCGINSPQDALQKGQNQNCRVYDVKENKCVPQPCSTRYYNLQYILT